MSLTRSNLQADKRPDLDSGVQRRFMQIGLLIIIQAIALFGSAGHLNWLAAWVYLVLYVGFIGLNAVLLLPHSKELIAERGTIRNDVKGRDKAILLLTTILSPAMLIIAGLDDRYGWSPFQLYSVRIGAVVVMCLSYALISWAMTSNAYFSVTVRIQQERGQTVVTTGPYNFVRHPGYVGMIASTLAMPLLLGSILTFVPALLLTFVIVTRIGLEDRTLGRELNGYEAYTKKVHYRLLPGI